ncbi:MAG TPA: hypothetical protein DD727_07305 [Clostridiales bacterium]|nr:hypothetical protein [Clostridiales bacterium]
MPAKAIFFAFCLAVTLTVTVMLVEMLAPLAWKSDLNQVLGGVLSKMEVQSGLPEPDETALKQKLTEMGYTGIVVSATRNAKKGETLTLSVRAERERPWITGLFQRGSQKVVFTYEKSTVARKIYN